MIELRNKRVAVIGLSKRTGVASARMLSRFGARVVVSDRKGPEELTEEIAMLADCNVEFELGGHGDKSLNNELIVVSPGVPLTIPFFKEVRKLGIPVISEIELAYHFTEAKIIAITGTNGKTTTTSLIGNILQLAFPQRVKVAGNIGTPMIQEAVGLTQDDWLVVEVSSFQLERIGDFRPHISLYLNFTPDHLDRHLTLHNYWLAKKRIFSNQRGGDYALINIDDPAVVKAASDCQAQLYSVSLVDQVEQGIFINKGYLTWRERGREERVLSLADIPLMGSHNQQNVAFAVAAAVLSGADYPAIERGIKEFTPFPHRMERLTKPEEQILIIDDSKATNPDAAINALNSFQQPMILIAGGQDRDADFTELAQVIKQRVVHLILLGETREKIKRQVLKAGFANINIHIVENMQEGVGIALKYLVPGYCLLLSPGCPSWDMYSSYQERGRDFRNAIAKIRGDLGGGPPGS